MRQKNDHQKHTKSVRGRHGQRQQFLQIKLIFDKQIYKEHYSEHGKDPINDEIVDYCSFDSSFGGELPRGLVLLRHWQNDPCENHDSVVDTFPDPAHVVGALHGVVDVEGEENDDAEGGEPGEVDHDFYGGGHLGQRVLVDQVGDVEQSGYHLHDDYRNEHSKYQNIIINQFIYLY